MQSDTSCDPSSSGAAARLAPARWPGGAQLTPAHPTQLFWHCKELVSELYDHQTLSQMEIHTGFGISGYDLVRSPLLPVCLHQRVAGASDGAVRLRAC